MAYPEHAGFSQSWRILNSDKGKNFTHFLSCLQPDIDAAVKVLLDLKAKYKAATGKDWKPGQAPAKSKDVKPTIAQSEDVKPTTAQSKEIDDLNNRITEQGNTVRGLKEKKAPKVMYISVV